MTASGIAWIVIALIGAWAAFAVMLGTMKDRINTADERWIRYWRTAAFVFAAATLAFSIASVVTLRWDVQWQDVLVLAGGAQLLVINYIALVRRSPKQKAEGVRWRAF